MTLEEAQGSPFHSESKALFQASLVIFVVTVVVGILNGLDLIEFPRPTLMTHVHAGTLGWISLGVFGASLWLFSEGRPASAGEARYVRWLSFGAIAAIALYVLTFFLNNATARPITGTLVLLVTVGFLRWVVVEGRRVGFTVPHLAVLAALTTLVIGAVLGVSLQIFLAGGLQSLPEGAFGSHPATMVAGYLYWRAWPSPSGAWHLAQGAPPPCPDWV